MSLEKWNKIIEKKLNKVKDDKNFQIIPYVSEDGQTECKDNSKYLLMFKLNGGHYKDQIHILTIDLKNGKNEPIDWFPTRPPKVSALTIIFHTNVSPAKNGWICLDILQDKWSPMNNFDTLVNNIILLLDDPAPSGLHLNGNAAELQQSCQKEFNKLSKNISKSFGKEYDDLYNSCFERFDKMCAEKYKVNKKLIEKYIPLFSKFNGTD